MRASPRNGIVDTAIGSSSLGLVLIAVTPRGIASVLIGDDEGALEEDLRRRMCGTLLRYGGPHAAEALPRVLRAIETPMIAHDFALDITGTDFQRRVWTALREIVPGETRSYSQIACAIGARTSVRAVAAACAANPIAVLIPCHRVVRSDGALSGYRWGIERKRELLMRERAWAIAA